MQFIRACDGDLWAAARRLCTYWKERKDLFRERAFLPLTLTGNGALTLEDTYCLQGGFPCLLPRTSSGQQVMFLDRRQLTSDDTPENRLRAGFYLAKKIAQDERAQTEGVTMLVLLSGPGLFTVDYDYCKTAWGLVANIFPVKIKFRILCLLPEAGKQYIVQQMISTYVKCMVDRGLCLGDIDIHIEREDGDICKELMDLGMAEAGIPSSVGGLWHYVECIVWCNTLVEEERAVERQAQRISRSRRRRIQRLERKRAERAQRARRQREQRYFERQALHEEHRQSIEDNKMLKMEYIRLKSLLEGARVLVRHLIVPELGAAAAGQVSSSTRDCSGPSVHETCLRPQHRTLTTNTLAQQNVAGTYMKPKENALHSRMIALSQQPSSPLRRENVSQQQFFLRHGSESEVNDPHSSSNLQAHSCPISLETHVPPTLNALQHTLIQQPQQLQEDSNYSIPMFPDHGKGSMSFIGSTDGLISFANESEQSLPAFESEQSLAFSPSIARDMDLINESPFEPTPINEACLDRNSKNMRRQRQDYEG